MAKEDIDFGAAIGPPSEPEVLEEPETLPAVVEFDTQPVVSRLFQYEQDVRLMKERAQGITIIQDEATNVQAVEWGSQAKILSKKLEELRHYYVDPHNKFLSAVNNFFKRYQEPLTEIEKSLGRKLAAFRQFQENERRRKEAEAAAEARRLEEKLQAEAREAEAKGVGYEPVTVVAPIIPKVAPVTRTSDGSASQRRAWTFEIEDETKIPRDYLMVDEQKIRRSVKAGVREIAGVRIFEDLITGFRV